MKYVVTAMDKREGRRVNVSRPLFEFDAKVFAKNLKREQSIARKWKSGYDFFDKIKVDKIK